MSAATERHPMHATISAEVLVIVGTVGLIPIQIKGGGGFNSELDLHAMLMVIADQIGRKMAEHGHSLLPHVPTGDEDQGDATGAPGDATGTPGG